MNRKIYIAHPLNCPGHPGWDDPARNVERYLRFVAFATLKGFTVVSWVHHYLCHNRGTLRGDGDFYLDRDADLVAASDALWVAGDPEVSAGTRFEIEVAAKHGIQYVHDPKWRDPSFIPSSPFDVPFFVDDWQAAQDAERAWALPTFGRTEPSGSLAHLASEVEELREDPSDIGEYADCLLLLLDAAAISGFSTRDLLRAVWTKMERNKARTWGAPNAEGFCEHVSED